MLIEELKNGIKLELRMLVLKERGKVEYLEKNLLEQGDWNQQQTQPYQTISNFDLICDHIKLWIAFWVDNDTHFCSFYFHFYCFKETASIVRKTKDAITDG